MFENYTVAVKISLTDGVTSRISMLTRHLMMSEEAAGKLQKRLNAIKGMFAGGTALMGTGASLAAPLLYAIDKGAELQKQMIAVQIATRGTTAQMNDMRTAIEKVAGVTVFSNIDVAKMTKQIATGTGMGASQVQGILPAYAKYADVQLLLKGTPYEQSVKQAIGAAHGAGHYDPASLTNYLDLLTKASMVIPGSVNEVVRGLSYFQGTAKTQLGMDDENNIMAVALANRMGFTGTRAGSNLTAALSRSIPGVFGSGLLRGKSMQSLTAMHMVDAAGHAKVFDKNGHFSMYKWMGLTSDYVNEELAKHPAAIARQNIMENFQHAYGTNGSRLTATLGSKQGIEQWRQMGVQFSQYGGFEGMQKQFADQSVAQQYMNAKTNFTTAMTELGYTLLPDATKALNKFNGYMQTLIDWMNNNPDKVRQYALDVAKLAGSIAALGVVSIVTSGVTGLVTALGLLRTAILATTAAAAGNAVTGFNPFGGLGAEPAPTGFGKIARGARMLGKAVLPFSIGYGIGTIASDLLGLDSKIGGIFSSPYNPNAQSSNPIHVHTNIHLDGAKVGQAVSKHQAKALSRPPTGQAGFDPIQALWHSGSY